MKTLKGKLTFISFWDPITIQTEDGEIDLREIYFQVFNNLNGKKASMNGKMNDIKVFADDTSEYLLKYENKGESILMVLEKSDGFGMSNLGAYVPDILQRLNGMKVIVEYDEQSVNICHDETEKVYELNYTNGNSCRIPDNDVKEICKIGQAGCCIFLTASGNGFECEKFDSFMARQLIDRFSKGTMRASRIGNCKIVGRIDEKIICP